MGTDTDLITILIQRFRETGAAVKKVDDELRHVYQSNREHFTVDVLRAHLTMMREHYGRAASSYDRIAQSDYNHPVLVAYREVLLDRLRERDELMEFWETALRQRLS